MNNFDRLMAMLSTVAQALGPTILEEVAFVGGCVVGLLLTDDYTRQQVRSTDDVDLIVDVAGYADYVALQQLLRDRGFAESPHEEFTCRWRLKELIVDVMPTKERILGHANQWYGIAQQGAEWHTLPSGHRIRVVTAPYFLATKIEAFRGRGEGDYWGSRDVADIVTLIDGRASLADEVAAQGDDLVQFVKTAVAEFIDEPNFEYAVQSAGGENGREDVIYERLHVLAAL